MHLWAPGNIKQRQVNHHCRRKRPLGWLSQLDHHYESLVYNNKFYLLYMESIWQLIWIVMAPGSQHKFHAPSAAHKLLSLRIFTVMLPSSWLLNITLVFCQVTFKRTGLVGGVVPTPSPLAVSVAQHIKTSNSSTTQLTTPTFGKL